MSKKKTKTKTNKRKHKRKRKEKKVRGNVQLSKLEEKKEEGRGQEATYRPDQTKKKGNGYWKSPCALGYGYFCHLPIKFLPLSFFSILERNIWWVWGDNTQAPLIFSSLPSLQPNTRQKSFFSHFLSKVFLPPYFTFK